MSTHVRNALIVVAIAAAVYAVPGGGSTAGFVGALLSTLILASLVFAAWRMYREHRVAIFSLGDQHRAILYGAIGAAIVAAAGYRRMFDWGAPGVVLWLALVGGASFGVAVIYRRWREYV